ncbi:MULTISPECIES: hypothetical protein [unclassified Novosphingobium]|uniref:hypothetical protein n=1 Tax=unclassified Novosphingobium TaxID=2644732 RepID=UPI0025F38210|nr:MULTISPECIES: hypothetical protein [unclassified Novosphingobium]HQV03052.1 hypothetical protein [Novosphingobium sp.]
MAKTESDDSRYLRHKSITLYSKPNAFSGEMLKLDLVEEYAFQNVPTTVRSYRRSIQVDVFCDQTLVRTVNAALRDIPLTGRTVIPHAIYTSLRELGEHNFGFTDRYRGEIVYRDGHIESDDNLVAYTRSKITIYNPNSVNAQVLRSVRSARARLNQQGIANPTDAQLAKQAYLDVIRLRESSAQASQNPVLRDAEYLLRGFAGASLIRQFDAATLVSDDDVWNNLANMGGVISTAIYNSVKSFRIWRGQDTNSSEFPASEPGGYWANAYGWMHGLAGTPLEETIRDFGFGEPSKSVAGTQHLIEPHGDLLRRPPPALTDPAAQIEVEYFPSYFVIDVPDESYATLRLKPGRFHTFSVECNSFYEITLWGTGFTFQPLNFILDVDGNLVLNNELEFSPYLDFIPPVKNIRIRFDRPIVGECYVDIYFRGVGRTMLIYDAYGA